jgi:hypothetical protein
MKLFYIIKSKSFDDFNSLHFKGSQKLLTFGQYSNKPNNTKLKKRKIIYEFYKKLYQNN